MILTTPVGTVVPSSPEVLFMFQPFVVTSYAQSPACVSLIHSHFYDDFMRSVKVH